MKWFKSWRWIDGLLILGIVLVVAGIAINFKSTFWEKSKVNLVKKSLTPTPKIDVQVDSEVAIDIEGEVINPGVYKLKSGSRINDGLIMAGGLSAGADRDWVEKNLNKAELLVDGQKIYIPSIGEKVNSQVLGTIVNSVSKIVRINTATAEQLDTLSGIGPVMAKRIIDYRTKNGGFKDINELKLVSGIGDKLFEKIKDEISL